jgi:hypothetical protein
MVLEELAEQTPVVVVVGAQKPRNMETTTLVDLLKAEPVVKA